jgi:hypothetical protein
MSRDEWIALLLVVSFAMLVTAHVTLVARLAARRPRWRALAALAIPPLAPWWGFATRMRVLGAVWVAGAVAYGVLRLLAAR